MKILFIVFIILLVSLGSVQAQNIITGNTLYERCMPSSALYNWCLGFIGGIAEGLAFIESAEAECILFSPPDNITTGQEMDIVMKFLAENPQERHIRGGLLSSIALIRAFPCPKNQE